MECHYNSRFILKNFLHTDELNPKNKKFWVYHKNGYIEPSTQHKACWIKDLYTEGIEKFNSQEVESNVSSIVSKIIIQSIPRMIFFDKFYYSYLTLENKELLLKYTIIQLTRQPGMLDALYEKFKYESFWSLVHKICILDVENIEKILIDSGVNLYDNVLTNKDKYKEITYSHMLNKIILTGFIFRKIIMLVSKRGHFITSDFGIGFDNHTINRDISEINIYLPISPNYCLFISIEKDPFLNEPYILNKLVSPEEAFEINGKIIYNAKNYFITTKKILNDINYKNAFKYDVEIPD